MTTFQKQQVNSSIISRLDKLPTEILRRICEYTLPQGLVFTFHKRQSNWSRDSSWRLYTAEPAHSPIAVYRLNPPTKKCKICGSPCQVSFIENEMQTALVYVDRVIATEAHAVLYAGNTFSVYINSQAHPAPSLNSPLIFGPFGVPHRIHLVRDFRRIRITLDIDDLDTYGIIRLRARMQHFVDVIKEHAEDETQKSLLRGLHTRLLLHGQHLKYNRRCKHIKQHSLQRLEEDNRHIRRHMFTLEPLTDLRSLEEFRLSGCPEWFTQCLSMRVRGEKGPLLKLTWPTKTERRRQGVKKYKMVKLSTRKLWQPTYDWAEFAKRNGITLPNDAAELFP